MKCDYICPILFSPSTMRNFLHIYELSCGYKRMKFADITKEMPNHRFLFPRKWEKSCIIINYFLMTTIHRLSIFENWLKMSIFTLFSERSHLYSKLGNNVRYLGI